MSPAGFPPLIRWVLWGAISGSVIFYIVLLRAGLVELTPKETSPRLPIILNGLGFALAVASMGVRLIVRNVRDQNGRRTVPAWIFPAFITALALGEAPAIFGFLLGLQGQPMKETMPLFAVSLATLLINNPANFFPRHGDEV